MQKITPHLWFDKEAKEAAEFYASNFPNSKVKNITTLHDTPSGECDVVSFELAGQSFMSISAGPLFKFNPSVSFHVKCRTIQEIDALWEKLSKGGAVLMELGKYPFSEKFGWVQDRYGLSWQLSWQLIFGGASEIKQKITPMLLFVGQVAGKAEEAINFYRSVFSATGGQDSSKVQFVQRYGKGEEPDREGTVKYAHFTLLGQEFEAMDSAHKHNFNFNEAISFMVNCDTQKEIDYYWDKLSADPNAEQCGWLKDRFGLSWQIVPASLNKMMQTGTKEQIARVTQAFLKMKKFDIAELQRAYEGK
jgi:predicted 3-demethylubiquinone-9 3-methyltransferase (glyoxalase superfamily)